MRLFLASVLVLASLTTGCSASVRPVLMASERNVPPPAEDVCIPGQDASCNLLASGTHQTAMVDEVFGVVLPEEAPVALVTR